MRAAASLLALLALAGCVYVPRTSAVYDPACHIEAKHMTLETAQIGALGHCQGQGCAELLVAAGAVAAASAVVSGSIVITGNIVYWFEKQGRCLAQPAATARRGTDGPVAGIQVGQHKLQDVLSRFGNSPLHNGDVDELCYRSESPLEPYWVLFGSGAEGNYETITQIRVVFSPPRVTCPPSALLTPDVLQRAR